MMANLRVFTAIVLLAIGHNSALAVDFARYEPIHQGFQTFIQRIDLASVSAVSAPNFVLAVDRLWLFFAFLLVFWTMYRFAFRGLDVEEVLSVVFMALLTRVLLSSYLVLMNGIWQIGDEVGAAIQSAMVGSGDRFFGPAFIVQLVRNVVMPEFGVNVFSAMYGALVTFIVGAVSLVLSLLSFVASIWGLWGFTIAKIIGMFFIPFLLFERLSFLFDGWLRFFLGWVIYSVIARVNVVLVVVALSAYYRVPLPAQSNGIDLIFVPQIASIFELIGLFTFSLVGIIALASTGRFAATVLAGAAGGGIGTAANQFARNVSRLALRGR